MTTLAANVGKFMAKTYMPATVAVNFANHTNGAKNKFNYNNLIFGCKYENTYDGGKFVYSDASTGHVGHITTPEIFIRQMIDKSPSCTQHYVTNAENIISFNTNGSIPFRNMQMLSDFCGYPVTIDTDQDYVEHENRWINKCRNFSDEELANMIKHADNISRKSLSVSVFVKMSPNYIEYDYMLKNVAPKRMPVDLKYDREMLHKRIWISGDGDFSSPATKIFFKRSAGYSSLQPPFPHFLSRSSYRYIFSASGGIDFSYCKQLPWFKLLDSVSIIGHHDVGGFNSYRNTRFNNVTPTELLIFTEILRKEGAVFSVNVENV